MATAKPLKPIGYVFWPYDSFPYALGAVATKVGTGGFYPIPSYGPTARIKAEYLTEVSDGLKIQEVLDSLKSDYLTELRELNEKYMEKALVAAPFLKSFNSYRNYQEGKTHGKR